MNIDLSNWRDYFVEENIRPMQEDVLDFISDNYNKYKNFVLNLPVGSGKSAIAYTLGKTLYYNNKSNVIDPSFQTYITTTTIQLQNQYIESYGNKGLITINSSQNFNCHRLKQSDSSCKDAKDLFFRIKKKCYDCCYDRQRNLFLDSPVGVTNLSYYLYQTEYAFTNGLPNRGLIIFDEAHKLSDFIQSFVTFELSRRTIESFNIKPPKPRKDNSYSIVNLKDWIKDEYGPALRSKLQELEVEASQLSESEEYSQILLKVCKRIDSLKKTISKFIEYYNIWNDKEWVSEWINDKISVTPISCKNSMRKLLFDKNNKNILMSGTFLDKDYIINEYDLDPKETCFINKDLTFPKENRPIHYIPCGKIKHDDMDSTMAPFCHAISEILEHHKNEKGIIFVSSYKQMNCILNQINDPLRLTTHIDSKDKESALIKHKNTENSVLISPSMSEGVDLKDDLSRFQIIIKMPFPSLESNFVKRKSILLPDWYAYQTLLTLIQSTGRSIRNENDFSVTYILDENFLWFYNKWKKFIPKYWSDALHF